jgi:putative spermidine/putrescine transport system permease protein
MLQNGGWKTAVQGRFAGGWTERLTGWLLLVFVILLPLLWMIAYALACSLGRFGLEDDTWTTKYWRLALSTSRIWRSLLLSSTLAACATFFAWQTALWLVSRCRGLRFDRRLQALWCLPLAIPPAVQAFLANLLLNRGGLLSRLCRRSGLTHDVTDFPVLVQDRLSLGLLLTMTAASTPLLLLLLIRIWNAARIEVYLLAARSLGAAPAFAMRHVALPMLRRRARPLLLLLFLWNFSAWELPLLLGRQSPRMFSVLIQQNAGQFVLDERPQAFVYVVLYLILATTAIWWLSAGAGAGPGAGNIRGLSGESRDG